MKKTKVLVIASLTYVFQSCATNDAWVVKKEPSGGMIGYAQGGLFTSKDDVLKDFKKAALKICGKKNYVVVREIFPAPSEAFGGAMSVANKDYTSAANSAGSAANQVSRANEARISPTSKIEYGSPLKSWNEAEIKCTP